VTQVTETNETVTTITSAAPGLIIALRRAASIAAEHGHNYIGVEDVLAALLDAQPTSVLEVHWQLKEHGALTYPELRDLVQSIIPGASAQGSSGPASVTFELTGPNADELTEIIATN